MAANEFKSVFADEIHKYADSKKAGGYSGDYAKRMLKEFDRYCHDRGMNAPVFTKEDAGEWIRKRKSESDTTHYNRINASKNFLKYLSLKGYEVYVIRDVKYIPTNFHPHIYSQEEVTQYFLAVDNCSASRNSKYAIQFPVFFRIMYCCGTRVNETLGIRKKDVDLDHGIIMLNETKGKKQRYIVLGEDLHRLVAEYADKCFYQLKDDDYIFTNERGGRIDKKTIYNYHRDFLQQASIPYVGNGNGPRIHDWRHTMAVYSFKKLADSGMDMYVALPILSSYLGHKTIFATEKYIRLTMQIFPYIEEKFSTKINTIFDIVTEEGELNEND